VGKSGGVAVAAPSRKGDTADTRARQNEPVLTFRESELWRRGSRIVVAIVRSCPVSDENRDATKSYIIDHWYLAPEFG
jgi:hypothetical protein